MKLVLSGWFPGRNVGDRYCTSSPFTFVTVAREILSEFGGLRINNGSELTVLDPNLCRDFADALPELSAALNIELSPLGFVDYGEHDYLCVDEAGTIYMYSDELQPVASSWQKALDNRICGMRYTAFQKDLKLHGLYGKSWRLRNDPFPSDNNTW